MLADLSVSEPDTAELFLLLAALIAFVAAALAVPLTRGAPLLGRQAWWPFFGMFALGLGLLALFVA